MNARRLLLYAIALAALPGCGGVPQQLPAPAEQAGGVRNADLPRTDVAYRFDLVLDEDAGTLSGEGRVRVRNTSGEPLEIVPLVLYPNRFRELDPKINDVNFDRFYDILFDEGGLTLRWVRDRAGEPLTVMPQGVEGLPAGTVVHVRLSAPVAPGRWADVVLAFDLEIPERFGPFGQKGSRIVLEGGALPYVPARNADGVRDPLQSPARAVYSLDLNLKLDEAHGNALAFERAEGDDRVIVGGGPPAEVRGDDGRLKLHTTTPLLVAGPDLAAVSSVEAGADTPAVRVFGDPDQIERSERLIELAQEAGSYLHRHFLPESPPGSVTFVQAPLRDRFLHPTDQAVLYSDRLFRLFFVLRGFHEVEVQRVTILSLIRQALAAAPLEGDRDWVCEALSWAVVRELVTGDEGVTGEEIRNFLSYFDIFPAVDQILQAPKFAGSDVYYGRFHESWLSVPDDLFRALSRRQRGRVVIEKLREKVGDERLHQLVLDTLALAEEKTLRELATEACEEDLRPFFDLWLGPLPSQNLNLVSVETVRELPDGGEEVEVTIVRTGDSRIGEVGEPVEVETTGPDGEPARARWDGIGDEGRILLRHDGGWFTKVQLDPEDRIAQAYRGDDVRPRYFKFLLSNFSLSLDLNQSGKNQGNLGFTIHPYHRYNHAILLDIYADESETGASLGYGYAFGKAIDERSYSTGLRGDFTYQRLRSRGNLGDSVILESEGDLISLTAGIGFDSRLSSVNPSLGLAASLGVEYSDRAFATDFRFVQTSGQITLVYSPIRGTTLGLQAVMGQTDGNRVPTQRLFDAGGVDSIRGVEANRFYGESLVAFRTELRQMLIEDLDQSLLWFVWLRKFQVVAFIDTGNIGRRIDRIFDATDDWKMGAGMGFRLHLDLFGVSNFTIRADVGVRLDDNDDPLGEADDEPQFYMGVKQTF